MLPYKFSLLLLQIWHMTNPLFIPSSSATDVALYVYEKPLFILSSSVTNVVIYLQHTIHSMFCHKFVIVRANHDSFYHLLIEHSMEKAGAAVYTNVETYICQLPHGMTAFSAEVKSVLQ